MGMNLWTSTVDYTGALSLFFFPCFFVRSPCCLCFLCHFSFLSLFFSAFTELFGLAHGYPPFWLAGNLPFCFYTRPYTLYTTGYYLFCMSFRRD
jgi:hypothetical protein